jgi:hypothetical protein
VSLCFIFIQRRPARDYSRLYQASKKLLGNNMQELAWDSEQAFSFGFPGVLIKALFI